MATTRTKTPPLRAALQGASGTLAATVTAAPLSATSKPCTGILVEAALANTVTVLLGMSDGQTVELGPGDVASIPVGNVNLVYAKTASSTATVNWWSLYGDTPGMGFAVFRSGAGTAISAGKVQENLAQVAGATISSANPAPVAERFIVAVGSTLTRAANVTPYTANDAVSNNATIGSVTPMTFTVPNANNVPTALTRMRVLSTDTGPGGAGAFFRAWLFNSDPTANSGVQGGDNTAWSQKQAGFIGTMSGVFRAFQDGSGAVLTPDEGPYVITTPGTGTETIWCLFQVVQVGFTPSANSTTFTPTLEAVQGLA